MGAFSFFHGSPYLLNMAFRRRIGKEIRKSIWANEGEARKSVRRAIARTSIDAVTFSFTHVTVSMGRLHVDFLPFLSAPPLNTIVSD